MAFLQKASFVAAALAGSAFAVPFGLAPAAAACNRTALTLAADAYVAAQTAGQLEPLLAVTAANWSYVENNSKVDVAGGARGVLAKALKIDHRRTVYDMVVCATFSELVSASDAANPYVIGVQLHHDASGAVVLVDSIVSTTGAWLFDAKKTLTLLQQETWAPIPEAQRDPRALIQAAGDAYLDMWSNATASQAVPWGTPCTRLEGSAYTGHNRPDDSCKPGIPSNHNQAPNTHRRYVIDESMGTVSIFCVWEHMMNAADSHEFRLEGGKLRYVHTMTSCGNKTCRL